MKFRQGITKEADNNNGYPVLNTITEAAEDSLPKTRGSVISQNQVLGKTM